MTGPPPGASVHNGSGRTYRQITGELPEPLKTRAPMLIQSSAQFVKEFVPPEYVIVGLLQRRFSYSLTAKTGSGKTALLLFIAACIGAVERDIGEYIVKRGRVLYFAGENPDDVRMRWIAMADEMGFVLDKAQVYFIPGRFKISEMRTQIMNDMQALGGAFNLVIIDTSAAYFEGDDENNNKQMGEHAARIRSLIELPGRPCIVTACHPVKNAADDNLLPKGGGNFLNEVDGNLTLVRTDMTGELHWQGKFRGPEFSPIMFQLRQVTNPRLKDSDGRLLPTILASHLSEEGQQEIDSARRIRQDALLQALAQHGDESQAELAKRLGWFTRDGTPYKTLVSRTLVTLQKGKLINKCLHGFELTGAGKKHATQLNGECPYVVIGVAGPGERCTLCGKASKVKQIRYGDEVNTWHPECAHKYIEAITQSQVDEAKGVE
jgi:AAA domain